MPTSANVETISILRGRVSRTKKIQWFFIVLMPLGFLLPCAAAIAVIPKKNESQPSGITAPQILGMIAFGLPIVGFAGTLLMSSDLGKCTRSLAMSEKADELGFQFSEKPSDKLLNLLGATSLFGNAKHCAGFNEWSGERAGKRIALLEYSTANGMSINKQTVVVVYDHARLPDFRVGPRGWLDRAMKYLGANGIELHGQDDFNRQFSIWGNEPSSVQALFTSQVIESLMKSNLSMEAYHGVLILFKYNKVAWVDDYAELIQEALAASNAVSPQPS